MDFLNNGLSLLSIAFGFTGIVGGLVGFFAKGRADAIIKAQAELIDVRDKQISDRDTTIASITSENKILTQTNQVLKDLSQGSPQLKKIDEKIKNLPKAIAHEIQKLMKGNEK